jgi:hypothetical protein
VFFRTHVASLFLGPQTSSELLGRFRLPDSNNFEADQSQLRFTSSDAPVP